MTKLTTINSVDLNSNSETINRSVVRLGEHNISTTDDGPHQDIPVCYADKHEKYINDLNINDIALITLTHDAKFNGKSNVFSNILFANGKIDFDTIKN